MQIPLPPGYRHLAPLDRLKHAGRGVARGQSWAAALTGVYLSAAEFVQAARHYPVVFTRGGADTEYVPLALTGLESGVNLFVDRDGNWEPGAYQPAYVRRWPLYGVRVEGAELQNGKLLICVDENGLADSGPRLFDATGEATGIFKQAETLVRELEAARPATETLCREVRELQLLEPFEARALPKDGQAMRVEGMWRVNEERLNALPAETVMRLMRAGILSRLYAHLMSLDNFKFLLDRAAARSRPALS